MSSLRTLHCAAGATALALLTGVGALALAAPASAVGPQTRYVATTGDDGTDPVNDCTAAANPCKTIQHAVDESNAGDTVSVAAGTYAESIQIGIPLTVVGASRATTKITGASTDPGITIGNSEAPPTVTLRHLTVTKVPAAPGVFVDAASGVLDDVAAVDNGVSGLIAFGGSVQATASAFDDNGAQQEQGFGGFGILTAGGSLSVTGSSVTHNGVGGIAAIGINIGGPQVRSAAAAPPELELHASTVSGNAGPGVVSVLEATTIDNSTIADNAAAGVDISDSTATITRSTVTGTKKGTSVVLPGQGSAGVVVSDVNLTTANQIARSAARTVPSTQTPTADARADLAPPAATVSLGATIVAGQAGVPDCSGTVTDGGYNLSSDSSNSCKFSAAKHSVTKTAAKLGVLADNGGPTMTEKPLKGSPAIDGVAAGSAGCAAGASDQRGVARPQPTGGACDIGAVELAAKAVVIHPASLPDGTVGEAYDATLTATGGAYPTYVWSLAPGSSLPDGLSLSSTGHITGTPTAAGTYLVTVSVNDPVLKRYTIVIDAGTGANGSGSEPISATGAPVGSVTALAAGSIFAGFLLMVGAGLIGRRPGRHRVRS